jgi:hypothetical protein
LPPWTKIGAPTRKRNGLSKNYRNAQCANDGQKGFPHKADIGFCKKSTQKLYSQGITTNITKLLLYYYLIQIFHSFPMQPMQKNKNQDGK